VAAALDAYGLPFEYECPIAVHDQGRNRQAIPDFYIPSLDCYIEYYGRAGNAAYDARTKTKQRAYAQSKIDVISIYPWNLCESSWPHTLTNALAQRQAKLPFPSSNEYGRADAEPWRPYGPTRAYR